MADCKFSLTSTARGDKERSNSHRPSRQPKQSVGHLAIGFAVLLAGLVLTGCGENAPPAKTDKPDDDIFAKLLADSDSQKDEKAYDAGFRFTTIDNATAGIDFQHEAGNSEMRPFPAANGSGVGVIDLDLDGLADLYFANGTAFQQLARIPDESSSAAASTETQLSLQATGDSLAVRKGDLLGIQGALYQAGESMEIPAGESRVVPLLGAPTLPSVSTTLPTDLTPGTPITFFPGLRSPQQSDRFYRNLGDFKFQDIGTLAHAAWDGYSAGVAVGDFNSDGFPDFYVNCYGQNQLFQNQGDGTFQQVTQAAQADDPRWGSSAAFLDYNDDGWLDLYVGNYAVWDLSLNKECFGADRTERIFCSPMSVEPAPDKLLMNNGDGTFEDVSEDSGILPRRARTQGVLAGNFDGEPGTDLYLGNDMHPNSLFLNQGQGRFKDMTDQSGMGYDSMGKSQAGMGLAAADIDQNGSLEVFVTNYAGENNAFYQMVRKNGYSETSSSRGLSADSVRWVGWGTAFLDIDQDHWPDLVVTNGHTDHNKPNEPYLQPCLVWHNEQGRFRLTGADNGSYFTQPHLGRGLGLADLDNDGDWDLVFAHLNHPPAILRNDSPRKKDSLTVELEGTAANRDAIATQLEWIQDGQSYRHHLLGGGSYLSTHQQRLILPYDPSLPAELKITWPDGQVQTRQWAAQELPASASVRIRQ